jgi:hypothetical protein
LEERASKRERREKEEPDRRRRMTCIDEFSYEEVEDKLGSTTPPLIKCIKDNICEDSEVNDEIENKRKECRELDKCKVQLTNEEETLKSQERGLRMVKKIKRR